MPCHSGGFIVAYYDLNGVFIVDGVDKSRDTCMEKGRVAYGAYNRPVKDGLLIRRMYPHWNPCTIGGLLIPEEVGWPGCNSRYRLGRCPYGL